MTNYTRPVDLREGAISIDVKQRVIYSQKHGASITVCAEPSPDALTVISASGGLSLPGPSGNSNNASGSLSEAGASIGLRTQSIQLLRDAMYRLCEGYAGGAITEAEFAAMQRRYQSTMMGLIAIEQLTGPVIASQATLVASATGQAGASAGDAAVDQAQTKVQQASDAVLNARTSRDTAEQKLSDTRSEINDTQSKIKTEQAKDQPDAAVLTSLNDGLKMLNSTSKTQTLDLADKQRRLDEAEKTKAGAEADLAQARSRVASSSNASANLSSVAAAIQHSNEALASTVEKIVKEINQSYSRDGCLTLVTQLAKSPESILKLQVTDPKLSSDIATAETNLAQAQKQLHEAESALPIPGQVLEAETTARKTSTYLTARDAADAAQIRLKELRATASKQTNALDVLDTSFKVCKNILDRG